MNAEERAEKNKIKETHDTFTSKILSTSEKEH